MTLVLDAERQKLLLHKREDFRIWALAGGGVEANETFEAAAIRETEEETGYKVTIKRHIGDYYRPQMQEVFHLYEAYVVGGAAIQRGAETLAVAWYPINALPVRLAPSTQKYLNDTLANHPQALAETQEFPLIFLLFWKIAFRLRDLRNRLFHRPQS